MFLNSTVAFLYNGAMRKKPIPPPPAAAVDPVPDEPTATANHRQGKRINANEFWDLIKSYPNHDGSCLYVNRLFPSITRQTSGYKHNYLEVLRDPYPEQNYIFVKHGGGKYQLFFNDRNRTPNTVANTMMEMSIQEKEPLLNYIELNNIPENAPYLQALKVKGEIVIDEAGNIVPVNRGPKAGQAGEPHNLADAMDRKAQAAAIDVVADTSRKLVDYALAQNKPVDLVQLIGLFNQMQPKESPIMPLVSALMTQNTALMQMLVEQKNQPAKEVSQVNGIDSAIGLIDKLSDRFGFNVPKPADSGWKEILAPFAPALVPFAQMFATRMMNEQVTPIRPIAGLPPPSPVQTHAQTRNNENPPTANQATATAEGDPAMQQVRQLGNQVVSCLDRGITGDDLAVSIVTFYGQATYAQMATLGKENLLQGLRMMPDIWQRLAPVQPQLDQFIEDFLNAFTAEESREEEKPDAVPAYS